MLLSSRQQNGVPRRLHRRLEKYECPQVVAGVSGIVFIVVGTGP